MGCDIHIIAEVKKNGKWKANTVKIFPDYYTDGKLNDYPDDGRSYDWFAILADVRNGRGFAGCVTGEGFKVIAEPKGIPKDASKKWIEITERWEGDMHSHSWLTLEEFDKFDWNQVTMKYGVIPLNEYKKLRGTNNVPDGWSGGVWGNNIREISQEKADKLINTEVTEGIEYYVKYQWPVLYSQWFERKIKNVVEPLRKLSKQYPEGVRIVFGFDN